MSNSQNSKKTRHISLCLRIVVAVAAIFWVCRGQQWGEFGRTIGKLNLWYFAASLGIFIISQILVGLRWWLLLRAQSIFIGFWPAVRLHFLGLFYNNFMPGSLGGDLIRAWYVTKHTDKKLEAALSVFVDRVIGLLGMIIIAVVCYLLFMRGKGDVISSSGGGGFLESATEYKWVFLGMVVVLAVVFGVLLLNSKSRAMLKKAWSYIRVHGMKMLEKFRVSMIIYCRKPITILGVIGLTIFLQSLVITAFWLLGINLEIGASAKYYFVFFPITWVLGAVPVSIAGIGILEGGLRELFTRFTGAIPEAILALALCQRFIWIISSLPGAAIHLLGAHLPKDFFIDYDKSIN